MWSLNTGGLLAQLNYRGKRTFGGLKVRSLNKVVLWTGSTVYVTYVILTVIKVSKVAIHDIRGYWYVHWRQTCVRTTATMCQLKILQHKHLELRHLQLSLNTLSLMLFNVTAGLRQYHVQPHSFLRLQITRSDIRHVKWIINLVIANGHVIFLLGMYGLTYSLYQGAQLHVSRNRTSY